MIILAQWIAFLLLAGVGIYAALGSLVLFAATFTGFGGKGEVIGGLFVGALAVGLIYSAYLLAPFAIVAKGGAA